MSYHTTVIYPRREGGTFDMKYYIDTHMALVSEGWKPEGLVTWEIVEFAGDAPYTVVAHLTWKDEASQKAAFVAPAAKGIFDDIPNFSSEGPTVMHGRVVSRG